MGSNWLRGPREAVEPDGLTQEALAAALNVNVKTIQRLERCGSDTPQQVRYADLAKKVGVCPIQLAENHARDLDTNGQPGHAQRARAAADRLRQAKHFPSIDPEPIRRALAACDATGLVERIAERESDLPDAPTQAAHIARLLDSRDLNGLSSLLNKPLRGAIDGAADSESLDCVADFLRAVVYACAANDPSLKRPEGTTNEAYQHHGESKSWPFAAMIDQSCNLESMRLIPSLPGNRPLLDDAAVRAVRSGCVTMTSIDGRLHELVSAFADLLAFDDEKPIPGDTKAFENFCDQVNLMLWNLNYEDEHVFGLWERTRCEPDEVKQRLLQLLPYLRLFDCGEASRTSSVLRVDRAKLEIWYASRLKAVNARCGTLATTQAHSTPSSSTAKPEQTTMTESQGAPVQFNFNIHSGNGPANMAAGPAQAHQHNLTTPQAELLPLLERLLAETGTGDSRYADLRKACRSAQGEVEENQPISEATKSLFQRAVGALPAADKVVELATKAAELLGKIPGFGA
ncbi:helix-turn-helix domain-containing protein [Thiorhodococcus fuscus]|uniref:Helix-turn-helix domain-containing protein n=1 Tax=Thiorhodococcus fuscus TaxID=527200 RepID=A0ABW4YDN4_9GAMM